MHNKVTSDIELLMFFFSFRFTICSQKVLVKDFFFLLHITGSVASLKQSDNVREACIFLIRFLNEENSSLGSNVVLSTYNSAREIFLDFFKIFVCKKFPLRSSAWAWTWQRFSLAEVLWDSSQTPIVKTGCGLCLLLKPSVSQGITNSRLY